MSEKLTPAAALRRVPGFDAARLVTPLDGGLTNRNFLIDRNGRRYVLRLDDVHTASFGIDRETERRAHRSAASAGLACRIVFDDVNAGILVTEYAEAGPLQPADLRDPLILSTVAQLLRDVHSLPVLGRRFDAESAAAIYFRGLFEPPPFAAFCLHAVRSAPPTTREVCCHNDVVADNIVILGGPLMLDWEYAADNEPMFDLASLICFHDLGEAEINLLLAAYDDGDSAANRIRLAAQMRLFDALQWLWIALRQQNSPSNRLAIRLGELQQRMEDDACEQ